MELPDEATRRRSTTSAATSIWRPSRASRSCCHDMIQKRYAKRPYGWPRWKWCFSLARLLCGWRNPVGDGGGPLPIEQGLRRPITNVGKWRRITVVQRVTADPRTLQKARQLGKDVFAEMGPDSEDALFEFLQRQGRGLENVLAQLQDAGRHRQLSRQRRDRRWPEHAQGAAGLDESNKFLDSLHRAEG